MDHPLQIFIVWYMQICMKATEKELEALRVQIAKARADSSLSDAELAQISRVHPSQVSRICRGSFRTISNNVVQICNVLEVPMQATPVPWIEENNSWRKLEASVRKLWDNTPEGADRIVRDRKSTRLKSSH